MNAKFRKSILTLLVLALSFISAFMFACSCEGSSDDEDTAPSITLDYNKLKMETGSDHQFTATLNNLEGEVSWYSYDSEIVSVDETGKATAVKKGVTTILAMVGEKSASCDVTVLDAVIDTDYFNVKLSQTQTVLNANGDMNQIQLSATVLVNGQQSEAQVSWSSSNEEYVTVDQTGLVKAVKNGGLVTVTASVTTEGKTVSAKCTIATEDFVAIISKDNAIDLYTDETFELDFDVYKDGVIDDSLKSLAQFTSSNTRVASVSESGVITALNEGNATVSIVYGGKTASVNVTVGKTVYVSNASQFLSIDGAGSNYKFILQNDIDLSDYFEKNIAINQKALISSFDGILIGNGHVVSGYHRYSTSEDKGFAGIFKALGVNARIENLAFIAQIDVKDTATIISSDSYGVIKDCLFDISGLTPMSKVGTSLYEIANGMTDNCVIKLSFSSHDENAKLGFANNGYGSFSDVSLISKYLTYGGYYSGIGSTFNQEFYSTELYQTESDFIQKVGVSVSGEGKGIEVDFGTADNYDNSVFEVANDKVILKGATVTEYPEITVGDYSAVSVGQTVTLLTPTATDGATLSAKVFDARLNDITNTVNGGAFKTEITGTYYIIHYAKLGDVYSSVLKELKVTEQHVEFNTNKVLLKPNETFKVTANGVDASNFAFSCADEEVATVGADGTVSAKGVGQTYLTAINKTTSTTYKFIVDVVNDYQTISTVEELKAIDGQDAGKYYVLTNDIIIRDSDVIEDAIPGDKNYAYVIKTLNGTLDGQGHKISLEMDTEYGICGLFYTISATGTVKNLNYKANITYNPIASNIAAYNAAFTRTLNGKLEDSYISADLVATNKPKDADGLIGYYSQDKNSNSKANIENVIFDLSTEYNGEIMDMGYAIRFGTNPVAYAYDSVFIKNGISTKFFGDHGNRGSAVETTRCRVYKTVYDFVNAINGYDFSVAQVITKINDGEHVYSTWSPVWTIERDAIYLYGNKVTDVYHEAYEEAKAIEISEEFGVISWVSDSTSFEIVINGKTAVTTQEKQFAIYDYIANNYGTEPRDYQVVVKGNGVSGVALYKVIGITNATFVDTVKEIDTAEESYFKYFALQEDINLDYDDFTKTHQGRRLVTHTCYANIDGQGHRINVNVDTGTSNTVATMFEYYFGKLTNIAFIMNVKYVVNPSNSTTFLVTEFQKGGLLNCFVSINATAVDADGNVIEDRPCVIFRPHQVANFENNLFALTMNGDNTDSFITPFGDSGAGGPYLRNSAVIRNSEAHDICRSYDGFGADKGVYETYHYISLADFIVGTGTQVSKEVNATPKVENYTAVKNKPIYKSWNSVWEINEDGISLCGKVLARMSETGDDTVEDSDIPNVSD